MDITAIYPGTFDPITHGHTDVITRGARLFSRCIIAVAENVGKKPRFSLSERVALVKTVLAHLPNVTVLPFSNLLVDFAASQRAHVLIRGIRGTADVEFELQLTSLNRQLNPQLETVFLTPSDAYAAISSTFVKEISDLGGDVSAFVAPAVVKALRAII